MCFHVFLPSPFRRQNKRKHTHNIRVVMPVAVQKHWTHLHAVMVRVVMPVAVQKHWISHVLSCVSALSVLQTEQTQAYT